MAIDIVRAIPSDASSIVPVGLRAFEADRLNQELELRHLRDLTPTQQNEHLQWRIKRNERRMTGADKYWFKAVDSETGNPVGYTGMVPAKKESPETTTAASINDIFTEVPATIDLELYAVLERTLEEVKKRHMGDRDDFWFIASMAVLPEHQGKGIAKRLLLKEAELADAVGQDIYLESTPGAKRLYQSVGFEVLEEFVIRDTFPMTAMLRKAKSKS